MSLYLQTKQAVSSIASRIPNVGVSAETKFQILKGITLTLTILQVVATINLFYQVWLNPSALNPWSDEAWKHNNVSKACIFGGATGLTLEILNVVTAHLSKKREIIEKMPDLKAMPFTAPSA